MGNRYRFARELLVMGILRSQDFDRATALEALEKAFGPLAEATEEEDFHWTEYYNPEMGGGIQRSYILFREPVDPSRLPDIKVATNEMEDRFSIDSHRRLNLDPGLLAPGRFSLATTKDRAHRIPLAFGIYAELTLIYQKSGFFPLPWTYPDWASDRTRGLLKNWRLGAVKLYKEESNSKI
ncbi:MAG: hypothetical protein FD137_146 [Spirochaetes bacterium]|nr:MAG: hypothetical protein FD137_146 [Spirochaetota bacterium]